MAKQSCVRICYLQNFNKSNPQGSSAKLIFKKNEQTGHWLRENEKQDMITALEETRRAVGQDQTSGVFE
jgi:hypothetical protein